MASTSFTLDPALKDLLQIALGHKPRTVQANIALNNWAAEQLADKGFSSLNQAAMHCAINLLIRPEVAAEYFRFFDDRRGYKNELPLVETPGVLSPKARAKLLRKEVYRQKREAEAQAKLDALAPLLDALAARNLGEEPAEAEPSRFGFA